jgi:hypothetical protein
VGRLAHSAPETKGDAWTRATPPWPTSAAMPAATPAAGSPPRRAAPSAAMSLLRSSIPRQEPTSPASQAPTSRRARGVSCTLRCVAVGRSARHHAAVPLPGPAGQPRRWSGAHAALGGAGGTGSHRPASGRAAAVASLAASPAAPRRGGDGCGADDSFAVADHGVRIGRRSPGVATGASGRWWRHFHPGLRTFDTLSGDIGPKAKDRGSPQFICSPRDGAHSASAARFARRTF